MPGPCRTLEQMIYHVGCVARGNRTAWLVADAPWSTYQAGPVQAYDAAVRLLAAGAQMVKLEGGAWLALLSAFSSSAASQSAPILA